MRRKHTLPASIVTPELVSKFEANVSRLGEDDCWTWHAYRMAEKGKSLRGSNYGKMRIGMVGNRRDVVEYSHRLAWIIANRQDIPAGMVVRHTCDNPPCCNPKHLVLGTYSENAQDREIRGRGLGLQLARRAVGRTFRP